MEKKLTFDFSEDFFAEMQKDGAEHKALAISSKITAFLNGVRTLKLGYGANVDAAGKDYYFEAYLGVMHAGSGFIVLSLDNIRDGHALQGDEAAYYVIEPSQRLVLDKSDDGEVASIKLETLSGGTAAGHAKKE